MKIFYLAILMIPTLLFTADANLIGQKDFVLDQNILVKNIPPEASDIKIWIPYPAEATYQMTKDISKKSRWPLSITYDGKYKNKILHYSVKNVGDSSIAIKRRYKIKRYEYFNRPPDILVHKELSSDSGLEKYLTPNKLVTISPRVKELAIRITKGKKTTLDKARAIYNYVFKNVNYDKITPGWGRGDTERVCDLKKGNCTDFHSLFISLARASGIPAKFVIGIPLPKNGKGAFKSYHCWAEFYIKGYGWVPVDISEAWKNKSRYEYYFGTLDEVRVEFTHGRDIILEPVQNSEALNYFIYPYVEIDGKVFKDVETIFTVTQ